VLLTRASVPEGTRVAYKITRSPVLDNRRAGLDLYNFEFGQVRLTLQGPRPRAWVTL
jgi:hypothetical protein